MKPRLVIVALGLGLAAVLAWRSGLGARVDQMSYYAPDQYVRHANAFIAKGYLEVSCREREPRLIPRLGQAPLSEKTWYEESYLRADVERFNDDPASFGWTFAIDADCRLRGVNPAVHAIELPFHRRLKWLGSILYRGRGADATLRSAGRSITLRRPDRPVPAAASSTTRVASTEVVLNEGAVLLHFPGGRGRPAGRVFHVVDEVVVQNRVREGSGDETRLMGHRLQVGRWARLETGDWLTFRSRDPRVRVEETFVFQGGETREVASVVRRQNDRYERWSDDPGLGQVPDPVRDTEYPYLDQVAKTLDRVVALLPESEGEALSDAFDVQLTLERQTQLTVSEAFRGFCRQLKRRRGIDLPFSAGVTVMDGRTGDLLALATYPNAEDLEGVDLGARSRRRLLQNQNFVVHPIGSAGKPYFFMAVAQAYPELRGLEIAAHPPERYHPDLFHCRIPLGYHLLEGHFQEWIDFPTALEISCNKFTVELATLALAAERARQYEEPRGGLEGVIARDPSVTWPKPGQRSGLRLEGQPIDYPPDLGGFFFIDSPADDRDPERTSVVRCSNLDKLDLVAYDAPLARVTGAATYRGRTPTVPDETTRGELEQGYLSNRYDFGPWMPLVDHLSDGHERDTVGLQIRTTLQEISPERVNLALNQVTRIRADYISLLLGGGTSVWTNVQLSEALARLVSGHEVRARLAREVLSRDVEETDETAAAEEEIRLGPSLELDPDARQAVLEGLRRVVFGAQGTAKDMRGPFDALRQEFPEDTLALYSKTGSPVIEKSVPAVVARALSELVVRGRLRLEGTTLVVDLGNREVPYGRARTAGRDTYLEALHQGLAEVGFRRSRWIRSTIRGVVDDFAEDLASTRDLDELEGPLKVEDGRLLVNRDSSLFARQSVKSLAGVYHFVLVRLPGRDRPLPPRPEDLVHENARLLSVSIHLEAGEGSEDAVDAAVAIFPTLAPLLR